jgi:uncharacterized protein YlbG (UPF0298 family)
MTKQQNIYLFMAWCLKKYWIGIYGMVSSTAQGQLYLQLYLTISQRTQLENIHSQFKYVNLIFLSTVTTNEFQLLIDQNYTPKEKAASLLHGYRMDCL